ncbi:unnamed protein product [Chrysoparadoxa australica]
MLLPLDGTGNTLHARIWDDDIGKDTFLSMLDIPLKAEVRSGGDTYSMTNKDGSAVPTKLTFQWEIYPEGAIQGPTGPLTIKLHSAVGVPDVDYSSASDPFVTFSCGSIKAQSSAKEDSLNPVWEELIEMELNGSGATLVVRLYDEDGEVDTFLGEGRIDLGSCNGGQQMLELQDRSGNNTSTRVYLSALLGSDQAALQQLNNALGEPSRATDAGTTAVVDGFCTGDGASNVDQDPGESSLQSEQYSSGEFADALSSQESAESAAAAPGTAVAGTIIPSGETMVQLDQPAEETSLTSPVPVEPEQSDMEAMKEVPSASNAVAVTTESEVRGIHNPDAEAGLAESQEAEAEAELYSSSEFAEDCGTALDGAEGPSGLGEGEAAAVESRGSEAPDAAKASASNSVSAEAVHESVPKESSPPAADETPLARQESADDYYSANESEASVDAAPAATETCAKTEEVMTVGDGGFDLPAAAITPASSNTEVTPAVDDAVNASSAVDGDKGSPTAGVDQQESLELDGYSTNEFETSLSSLPAAAAMKDSTLAVTGESLSTENPVKDGENVKDDGGEDADGLPSKPLEAAAAAPRQELSHAAASAVGFDLSDDEATSIEHSAAATKADGQDENVKDAEGEDIGGSPNMPSADAVPHEKPSDATASTMMPASSGTEVTTAVDDTVNASSAVDRDEASIAGSPAAEVDQQESLELDGYSTNEFETSLSSLPVTEAVKDGTPAVTGESLSTENPVKDDENVKDDGGEDADGLSSKPLEAAAAAPRQELSHATASADGFDLSDDEATSIEHSAAATKVDEQDEHVKNVKGEDIGGIPSKPLEAAGAAPQQELSDAAASADGFDLSDDEAASIEHSATATKADGQDAGQLESSKPADQSSSKLEQSKANASHSARDEDKPQSAGLDLGGESQLAPGHTPDTAAPEPTSKEEVMGMQPLVTSDTLMAAVAQAAGDSSVASAEDGLYILSRGVSQQSEGSMAERLSTVEAVDTSVDVEDLKDRFSSMLAASSAPAEGEAIAAAALVTTAPVVKASAPSKTATTAALHGAAATAPVSKAAKADSDDDFYDLESDDESG